MVGCQDQFNLYVQCKTDRSKQKKNKTPTHVSVAAPHNLLTGSQSGLKCKTKKAEIVNVTYNLFNLVHCGRVFTLPGDEITDLKNCLLCDEYNPQWQEALYLVGGNLIAPPYLTDPLKHKHY